MSGQNNSSRYRIFLWAGIGLVILWAAVIAGYKVAEARRPTPEKVEAYVLSLDLKGLSPQERRAALDRLARMLNSLDAEARRRARLGSRWEDLFNQMSDEEKLWFVEATLPSGVRQMLDAFEALPEDRRERAINDSLRRLREARAEINAGRSGAMPTNQPVLSEEMERQMVAIGMKSFYSQSSAQTKAELAPVLEEMQRLMESGRFMRDRRRGQESR